MVTKIKKNEILFYLSMQIFCVIIMYTWGCIDSTGLCLGRMQVVGVL